MDIEFPLKWSFILRNWMAIKKKKVIKLHYWAFSFDLVL